MTLCTLRYLTLFYGIDVHTIPSPSTNHHHHAYPCSLRQFFIIFNFLRSLLTTVNHCLVTLKRFTYISHYLLHKQCVLQFNNNQLFDYTIRFALNNISSNEYTMNILNMLDSMKRITYLNHILN